LSPSVSAASFSELNTPALASTTVTTRSIRPSARRTTTRPSLNWLGITLPKASLYSMPRTLWPGMNSSEFQVGDSVSAVLLAIRRLSLIS